MYVLPFRRVLAFGLQGYDILKGSDEEAQKKVVPCLE